VNDKKGFYHCFGCGAHGGVIDFAMAIYRMPFKEAVNDKWEAPKKPLPNIHPVLNFQSEVILNADSCPSFNLWDDAFVPCSGASCGIASSDRHNPPIPGLSGDWPFR
jgi:CHC2 zinc finger